jgi:hypothetical protein
MLSLLAYDQEQFQLLWGQIPEGPELVAEIFVVGLLPKLNLERSDLDALRIGEQLQKRPSHKKQPNDKEQANEHCSQGTACIFNDGKNYLSLRLFAAVSFFP